MNDQNYVSAINQAHLMNSLSRTQSPINTAPLNQSNNPPAGNTTLGDNNFIMNNDSYEKRHAEKLEIKIDASDILNNNVKVRKTN